MAKPPISKHLLCRLFYWLEKILIEFLGNIIRCDRKRYWFKKISSLKCGEFLFQIESSVTPTLQWRHNQLDDVSNHRRLDCLLNGLSRRLSKKISKLRVTSLCEGNPPVPGGFPSQRASNAENVSRWWRHHAAARVKVNVCHERNFELVAKVHLFNLAGVSMKDHSDHTRMISLAEDTAGWNLAKYMTNNMRGVRWKVFSPVNVMLTHTHTHVSEFASSVSVFIYINICKYVCICMCIC